LKRVFGTTDVFEIAKEIIRKGEIKLTTEQRRRMVEEKKRQIAEIISKKGINPQTNAPHPPQRILKAMEDAGVNIDPFAPADMQVERVLKAIKALLPIKFEKVLIQLKIPPEYAGRVYGILKKSSSIKRERWLESGDLQVEIEILGGMKTEVLERVANLTHGQFESKILKRE